MLQVVAQAVGMLLVHVCDDALLNSIIGRSHDCGLFDSKVCKCKIYTIVSADGG